MREHQKLVIRAERVVGIDEGCGVITVWAFDLGSRVGGNLHGNGIGRTL